MASLIFFYGFTFAIRHEDGEVKNPKNRELRKEVAKLKREIVKLKKFFPKQKFKICEAEADELISILKFSKKGNPTDVRLLKNFQDEADVPMMIFKNHKASEPER